MNRRWYDSLPTVSMAVSLLQNTHVRIRENILASLSARIRHDFPEAAASVRIQHKAGLLAYLQKRTSMDDLSWQFVEMLRYLPEHDRDEMALEIIRLVYCSENTNFQEKYPADMACELYS